MSARSFTRWAARLGRAALHRLGREDGTASVEFVIMLPVFMVLVFSAVEAGMMQLRYVMMERGLDLTVRELRLGQIHNPTQDKVKAEICRLSLVLPDCINTLMVEMRPIDTTTWTGLDQNTECVDRSKPINVQSATNFNSGTGDELMLVRVCGVYDPIWPTAGLGLKMQKDATGAYHLVATSAFVNEPT